MVIISCICPAIYLSFIISVLLKLHLLYQSTIGMNYTIIYQWLASNCGVDISVTYVCYIAAIYPVPTPGWRSTTYPATLPSGPADTDDGMLPAPRCSPRARINHLMTGTSFRLYEHTQSMSWCYSFPVIHWVVVLNTHYKPAPFKFTISSYLMTQHRKYSERHGSIVMFTS